MSYKVKYFNLKFYKINKDLEELLNKNNINTQLLVGSDANDIIYEAQYNNIPAILIEYNYNLFNSDKINIINNTLFNYIRDNYDTVLITMPHYCVEPKEKDRNCDLYVDIFSSSLYEYLKDKINTVYLGKDIDRLPRYEFDLNRFEGRYQPMRNRLRQHIIETKSKKTILLDIHSFPPGSFNEKENTDIVLLQREFTVATS